MIDAKKSAVSGARWTLAARLGLQIITWPITIVVMRLLEPADYGLFALALVVHGFVTLFSELGFGVALVQASEVSRAQARMVASVVLVMNLSMAALIFVAAPWVALKYQRPEVSLVMRVLSLELLIAAAGAVPVAMLERGLRYRAIALSQMAGGFGGIITTLVAAASGAGVWALVAGNLVSAFLRVGGWVFSHGSLVVPGRVDLPMLRPMQKLSLHTLTTRLLWFWTGQSDTIVLGYRLNSTALGAYSVATQLAMLPASKAMEAVNKVSFPLLCRLQDQTASFDSLVFKLRQLITLYGFGICWMLAALAPDLVALLLGEKWSQAVGPLALLAMVAPLRMLAAFNNTVVTTRNRPEPATKEQVLAAVLIPASVAIGSAQGGLIGAAWAWLVSYPLIFAASTLLTAQALDQRLGVHLRPMLAPAVGGAFMWLAVWVTRTTLTSSMGAAVQLFAHGVLGSAVFLLSLLVVAPLRLKEALAVAKELVGRK